MTRPVHQPDRRIPVLALLPLLAACNRGPVRIPPGDGSFDAGVIPATGPADDGGRHADPEADGPCDPLALLGRLPTEVPGWRAEDAPIFPHEPIDGEFVGLVGRLYRAPDGRCAVAATGRPADVLAVAKALTEERLRAGRRGRVPTLTRAAPEADQVTTWAFPPDGSLILVRAFGTTDAAMLEPFLETLFPIADADAGAGAGTAAADPADAGTVECPPTAFLDVYDPDAFYSPPGDCRRP
ncbi:MAG: hypothetical protein JXB32_26180 [Deltaproteobacteria bacterium]|nr:hypothetical protein [Deltaproteobacteria bacterium]